MTHLPRLLSALAAITLAACSGRIELSFPESEARLALHACDAPLDDAGTQCGTLSVPEDRGAENGRMLRLPMLILRAKARVPGAEPVLVLGGGPGASAIAAFASLPAPLRDAHPLRHSHDLIVLDQRGTPLAGPGSMHCHELERDYPAGERFASSAAVGAAAVRCRTRLAAQGIDTGRYDSANSADDLEDLRRLLGPAWGFRRWHVVGTSYGSRLALTYDASHGQGVSALMLDGPLPPQVYALYDAGVLDAMERVAQARFDDADELLALSAWIDSAPNPSGMYTSVMCRDEAWQPSAPGRVPEQGFGWPEEVRIAAAAASNGTLSASICPAWMSAQAAPRPPGPVRIEGPLLVTVGEFDPVTPVGNADRIRQQMPQARTVVLAARGHGLLESDPCAVMLAAAFFRSPSTPLDANCAALANPSAPAIGPR